MTSVRKSRPNGIEETIETVVPPSQYIYVSIDTDVLDGAVMPGTTLPEPGGYTYDELVRG